MIAQVKANRKRRLSRTTIMSLKNLVRKGTDLDIENFVYEVVKNYMAEVRNCDYIEEEDYICIKDTNFECECPYCNNMISLDLKELSNI